MVSFFFTDAKLVWGSSKEEGAITNVTASKIEGWATTPGQGSGNGNTISFFIVKINVKGSSTQVSYRTYAVPVASDQNGTKKYTFSLDMTNKWPQESGTYKIVVDAYRTLGNGKEDYYFSFPDTAYEYQPRSAYLDFTLSASQGEYAKPANGDAQGRLDVTLIPQGKIGSVVRPPIDVVFVFDVSGSMDELGTNPMKFQSAKQALSSAVSYFKANANPSDRFALVPFSSDVQYNKVVSFPTGTYDVVQHLDKILQTSNSLVAGGGTNYTQALRTAQSFFNDPTRKKYIIFLTDGIPTVSTAKEPVTYEICQGKGRNKKCDQKTEDLDVAYVMYADGRTATRTVYYPDGTTETSYWNYQDAGTKIRTHAMNVAKNLGANNITLYSVGFGSNDDVDMNYLSQLSSMTGGFAKQGTTQNLTEIFQQFSKLATDPVLSGTIRIPLQSFGGNVQIVETENVWLDEAKANAYITFNIGYKVGQPAPSPINISVPVLFKAKGTYTLSAELSYRDVYGVLQPTVTKTVTVTVKDEVLPSFTGNVKLQGISRDIGDLIKYGNTNGDSDQFTAQYTLTPTGYVGSGVTGNLSNIKLIQPLPDGVTVVPSTNVTVYSNNGVTYAEIAFPNTTIDYTKLNSTMLTASLKLQANWAMEGVQLPQATVSFTDSKYGTRTSTLPVAPQSIGMKVRLLEFPDIYYEGDSRGLVSKWQTLAATTNLLATTKHPNDYGLLMLPIQSLTFKPNSNDFIIVVTYKDGQSVELNLTPQLKIFTNDGREIANGATVTEPVKVRVVGLVAGEEVSYQYQITNLKQNVNWQTLSAPYEIPITVDGTSVVSVKATGGFTKGSGVATVSLTYNRLITGLDLAYQSKMNTGDTQTISVTISPNDATNKSLQWISSDPTIATVDQGKVTAKSSGVVHITAKALDGSNVSATATITVVNPVVPLEGLRFTQQVLYVTVGDEIPLDSKIEFIPNNATNKNVRIIQSSAPEYVDVTFKQGKWVLQAKDAGYATITAVADEKNTLGQDIAASMVVIVQEKSTSPGSNGNDSGGKNRW